MADLRVLRGRKCAGCVKTSHLHVECASVAVSVYRLPCALSDALPSSRLAVAGAMVCCTGLNSALSRGSHAPIVLHLSVRRQIYTSADHLDAGERASSQCSLAYAAPEVLQSYAAHARCAAHPAADIWALGVIVYEALTDDIVFPPFVKRPTDIFAAASGTARYPWELDQDAQFSRYRIRPVVVACLARKAAARPTAVQLLAQLDRLINVTAAAEPTSHAKRRTTLS